MTISLSSSAEGINEKAFSVAMPRRFLISLFLVATVLSVLALFIPNQESPNTGEVMAIASQPPSNTDPDPILSATMRNGAVTSIHNAGKNVSKHADQGHFLAFLENKNRSTGATTDPLRQTETDPFLDALMRQRSPTSGVSPFGSYRP